MKKLFPALFGQALIALVISAGVAAFQARPGYFSTLTATSTLTSTAAASGEAWLKTGDLVFSTTGTCRTGFTELVAARGRYLVALPGGGTNAGTIGTALSDLENRPVGQHTHTLTDPGHNHTQNAHAHVISITDPGHVHTNSVTTWTGGLTAAGAVEAGNFATSTSTSSALTGISATDSSVTATNNSATTGITVVNSGSVAGTNAPYIQYILCRKD